jgi:guanylate kinase
MQNLFLVDGASGVGKSDLLRWVTENNAHNVAFLRKATTRLERDYERNDPDNLLDLEFMSEQDFRGQNFEYRYVYGGAEYGFHVQDLTVALLSHDNVFVIVRSTSLIRRIADDYKFLNVVPVFIYTDRFQLLERLQKTSFPAELIQMRLQRSEIALRDYYSHAEFYREILINNSSKEVFHSIIDRMIDKYSAVPRIDPYSFPVMMSFNPENKKLDDYYDAIESAVKSLSPQYLCRRIDKIPGSPKIASEFRRLAVSARCVIVDLTENKQHVYYELGYLHALERTCVITAEEGTQISFYPAEYKVVLYRSARELRQRLQQQLSELLSGLPGM